MCRNQTVCDWFRLTQTVLKISVQYKQLFLLIVKLNFSIRNAQVGGSTPLSGTNIFNKLANKSFFMPSQKIPHGAHMVTEVQNHITNIVFLDLYFGIRSSQTGKRGFSVREAVDMPSPYFSDRGIPPKSSPLVLIYIPSTQRWEQNLGYGKILKNNHR